MLHGRQVKFFWIAAAIITAVAYLLTHVVPDTLALIPVILLVIASFPWGIILSIIGDGIFYHALSWPVTAYEGTLWYDLLTTYFGLYINIYILIKVLVKPNKEITL